MTIDPFSTSLPFLNKARKKHISIELLTEKKFLQWQKSVPETLLKEAELRGFKALSGKSLFNVDKHILYFAQTKDSGAFDFAKVHGSILSSFHTEYLKSCSFSVEGLSDKDIDAFFLGWGMAHYHFKISDKVQDTRPALVWDKRVNKKRIQSLTESIYLLRNLINIPTIDMGPDELQKACEQVAAQHKASIKVIKGKPLEKGFPLVHAVGMASHRTPRVIEINWGKSKDPKICIVGKGVCFDTGGLDIKPSQYMRYMKKDMGGAAHAIALAQTIMALKLPVRLQMLIPAVENAVAAESFRPGDIFKSRKGITVENTNTDAEGRLVLSDCLTYGCEKEPELVIDFATLTGSARAALGQDIPAMFSNDDRIANKLQKLSVQAEDPLWAMPLWSPYKKHIESSVADLHNSAGLPGDLIYSALFLQSFLLHDTAWIHIDTFAWESTGRPGRAKGAMDMGLRSVLTYLEDRYG